MCFCAVQVQKIRHVFKLGGATNGRIQKKNKKNKQEQENLMGCLLFQIQDTWMLSLETLCQNIVNFPFENAEQEKHFTC